MTKLGTAYQTLLPSELSKEPVELGEAERAAGGAPTPLAAAGVAPSPCRDNVIRTRDLPDPDRAR
jgi:hypothetical protein